MSKPQNKTIKNVVEYLASQGLDIIAPNVDLETGQLREGNRCLNSEQTIQFLKLDQLWEDPEELL